MTATRSRKPKQRTLSYNRLTGILHVTDAKGEKGYYLDRLGHDFGPGCVAVRFTKIVPPADGTAREYAVLVGPDFDACDCMAHSRWNRCRHASAVRCLTARGDL